MTVIKISDELYERLKNCVVDPFDDTPESVISRLMDIVDKARARWASWDSQAQVTQEQAESEDGRVERSDRWKQQCEVVL